jgi:hypothetical protein
MDQAKTDNNNRMIILADGQFSLTSQIICDEVTIWIWISNETQLLWVNVL